MHFLFSLFLEVIFKSLIVTYLKIFTIFFSIEKFSLVKSISVYFEIIRVNVIIELF